MDHLKDLYRCKEQIESELKQIARFRHQYPKRFRPEPTTKRFESALLRLKSKWNQSINAIFHTVDDRGVYDKIAYDLTRSFHAFYAKYKFDSDQLFYAFRCLIVSVIGQLMDESDLGKRPYDRQERRKYFLRKLLSYGIQENQIARRGDSPTPSDNTVDVCSPSPSRGRSTDGDIPEDVPIRDIKPTPITIIIIDILVNALLRHNSSIARDDYCGKERICHVMNITHVVELVGRYFDELKLKIEENIHFEERQDLDLHLLSQSMERYEALLWDATNTFNVSHPLTVYKSQLDSLLFQVLTIKPMLKKVN